MKRNMLRWFGHIERMKSEEFVKNAYGIEIVGLKRRGRPLERWEERVREYMCERAVATRRGGLDHEKRECVDRERWKLFCYGHLLGGMFPEGVRHWSFRQIDR